MDTDMCSFRLAGPLYVGKPKDATKEQVATIGALCRRSGMQHLFILTSASALLGHQKDVVGKSTRKDIYTSRESFDEKDILSIGGERQAEVFVYLENDVALVRSEVQLSTVESISDKSQVVDTGECDIMVYTEPLKNLKKLALVSVMTSLNQCHPGRIVATEEHFSHEDRVYEQVLIIEQLNEGQDFAKSRDRGALVFLEQKDKTTKVALAMVVSTGVHSLSVHGKLIENCTLAVFLPHLIGMTGTSLATDVMKMLLNKRQCKESGTLPRVPPSVRLAASACVRPYVSPELTMAYQKECATADRSQLPRIIKSCRMKRDGGPTPVIPPQKCHNHKMRTAKFIVTKAGGFFRIPSMGVELRFPPGAVDRDEEITVSLPTDPIGNPSSSERWKTFSTRVRIEPEDLSYNKPVMLLMDHSIVFAGTYANGQSIDPMLIHRKTESDQWTVICSQNTFQTDDRSYSTPRPIDLPMFNDMEICLDKTAMITPSAVIVEILYNCEYCLVQEEDDMRIKRYVRQMNVELYADYQPQGGYLNVRSHICHGLESRSADVSNTERDDFGGNFVTRSTVYVEDEKLIDADIIHPITVRVSMASGPDHRAEEEREMQVNVVRPEWTTCHGPAPHVSFQFPVNSPGNVSSAPPVDAVISVCAFQGERWQKQTARRRMDIKSLSRHLQTNVPTELHQVNLEKVDHLPWGDQRTNIINLLMTKLSDTQLEDIKEWIGGHAVAGNLHSVSKRLTIEMFVGNRGSRDVANLLGNVTKVDPQVIEALIKLG